MDRLLAKNGLLGASGPLDEIGVGIGGGADGDRIDVLGGENDVDFGNFSACRLRQGGGRRRVRVGDKGHLAVGARRHIAAMDLADPTRPDHSEFHALLLFGCLAPDARVVEKKKIRSILTLE